MRGSLRQALDSAHDLLSSFRADPRTLSTMEAIVDLLLDCFRNGGKLLICGNGGSLADAMHVAEELSGRFRRDRRPLPAIALSDPAHMSCVANDYGFEFVFSRQVEALGKPGDVLLVMSTSGSSGNVVRAALAGRSVGMTVVGALGGAGGETASLCDLVLWAPGEGSDRIQELHMLAFHAILEAVENEID